ncbi:hypothetical protein LPB136_08635 [Tenacibaculum todarodis]|uniref:Uncharacterized protein n=1 Tax=Tenacibaculum todarodis TaxID=1850252 RepID=A0A1L3JJV2_9FLAO|nr:hypothetical protein [Tenacibaculum todarodis]APG65416.1 hypothetical protein LPB136_08635 [Tenacibaculum todarodis]
MTNEYLEYYPNKLAKDFKFDKHLKNEKRFQEYCRGKEIPYYKDEGNWGTKLDIGNIPIKEAVKRAFILQEFGVWKEWKNTGKNIFNFSKNLTELLKETNVLDLDISIIKLPYKNFYIDLTSAKIPFEENGSEFIEGAFITDENYDADNGDSFERAIGVDFAGKDYIEKYWKINKNLCWDGDRGFHSMTLFLEKNGDLRTIQDAINFDKKGFVGEATFDERDDNTKIELYLIHKQFVDRTINFIINCLLYLTTKDVDIEKEYPSDLPSYLKTKLNKANTKRKKEIVETEIIKGGFTKIKYVGRKIKSNYISNTPDREISTHWRKGHWRNQKIGENLLESKLIWIIPTIVNKEKGEPKKGHIYEIK